MAQLYDRYGRLVYALVLRIVKDRAPVEDLVNETFLRVWNRAQLLDEHTDAAGPWLLAVARNRAINYVKSLEASGRERAFLEESEYPRLYAGMEAGASLAEQARRIRQTVAQLPENQRQAIELAYFDGLSPTGMAAKLGQPLDTVQTSLRGALARMAQTDGNPCDGMSCAELREHYELYALGVAGEPERSEIHAHLERRCDACECGVSRALALVAALSASAPAAAPPARLRRRVLASAGVAERHYGWPVAWAAAALLCLSAAVYFSGRERQYAEESLQLRGRLGDQTTEIRRAREAFAILSAPGTIEAAIGDAKPAGPTGRVFVNPTGGVTIVVSHLPPSPEGRLYEMWIVPKSGLPRAAGLFQSRNDESAIHIEPGPINVANTIAITVTLENESGAPQPTSRPLIVAALSSASQ
jgi:RNA polymerase sigma-70 factor (ECF subfamily)